MFLRCEVPGAGERLAFFFVETLALEKNLLYTAMSLKLTTVDFSQISVKQALRLCLHQRRQIGMAIIIKAFQAGHFTVFFQDFQTKHRRRIKNEEVFRQRF